MPTLGVVFVHVALMWRVMQPETERQALYDDFFSDTFWLVFRGAIVESFKTQLFFGSHASGSRA